jgi:hypothetical protein
MKSLGLLKNLLATAALAAVAVLSCGCPADVWDKTPVKAKPAATGEKADTAKPDTRPETTPAVKTPKNSAAETAEEAQAPKAPDLGPPLVDDMADLRKLDPQAPVWIDKKHKQVVLVGETCQATNLLEFFATFRNRGYESVVAVDVKPSTVHAALLVLGAVPGHPVRFQPKFVAPSGTELAIEVRWKDKDGKVQTAPAQKWVRNVQTKKALDVNWVFAGSIMDKDPTTGKEYYLADHGEFICLWNQPAAMIDLPIRSTGNIENRMFEGFAENMPPAGTPVTILIKPLLEKKAEK